MCLNTGKGIIRFGSDLIVKDTMGVRRGGGNGGVARRMGIVCCTVFAAEVQH